MAPGKRSPKPVPIGGKDLGLLKLGASRFDLHDPYHLAVSLPWSGFFLVLFAVWLTLNLGFAALYALRPGAISNTHPGAFLDALFFSIETLATVGYGIMAPATLYGHVVSALETVTGLTFTAIATGLLFVRFSRPNAKIHYAENVVITTRDGQPTLMLRFANARTTLMSAASARLFVLLVEHTAEGRSLRHVNELKLNQPDLPLFIMPWTVMHAIDTNSPLHGMDAEALRRAQARLILTLQAWDHVLTASVFDVKDYNAENICFGMQFADVVTLDEQERAIADLSRLGLLVPEQDPVIPVVTYGQQ